MSTRKYRGFWSEMWSHPREPLGVKASVAGGAETDGVKTCTGIEHRPNRKVATTATQTMPKSVVSQNRSEGLRLFKLAGRPTRAQFVAVLGPNGPRMTWQQRAAAGGHSKDFLVGRGAQPLGRI